jgi:hypothetical protein
MAKNTMDSFSPDNRQTCARDGRLFLTEFALPSCLNLAKVAPSLDTPLPPVVRLPCIYLAYRYRLAYNPPPQRLISAVKTGQACRHPIGQRLLTI